MDINKLLLETELWGDIEQVWKTLAVGFCQLCILNGSFKTIGLSQPITGYGQNVVKEASMYAGFAENAQMFVLRKTKNGKDVVGTRHGHWTIFEARAGALVITRSAEP